MSKLLVLKSAVKQHSCPVSFPFLVKVVIVPQKHKVAQLTVPLVYSLIHGFFVLLREQSDVALLLLVSSVHLDLKTKLFGYQQLHILARHV